MAVGRPSMHVLQLPLLLLPVLLRRTEALLLQSNASSNASLNSLNLTYMQSSGVTSITGDSEDAGSTRASAAGLDLLSSLSDFSMGQPLDTALALDSQVDPPPVESLIDAYIALASMLEDPLQASLIFGAALGSTLDTPIDRALALGAALDAALEASLETPLDSFIAFEAALEAAMTASIDAADAIDGVLDSPLDDSLDPAVGAAMDAAVTRLLDMPLDAILAVGDATDAPLDATLALAASVEAAVGKAADAAFEMGSALFDAALDAPLDVSLALGQAVDAAFTAALDAMKQMSQVQASADSLTDNTLDAALRVSHVLEGALTQTIDAVSAIGGAALDEPLRAALDAALDAALALALAIPWLLPSSATPFYEDKCPRIAWHSDADDGHETVFNERGGDGGRDGTVLTHKGEALKGGEGRGDGDRDGTVLTRKGEAVKGGEAGGVRGGVVSRAGDGGRSLEPSVWHNGSAVSTPGLEAEAGADAEAERKLKQRDRDYFIGDIDLDPWQEGAELSFRFDLAEQSSSAVHLYHKPFQLEVAGGDVAIVEPIDHVGLSFTVKLGRADTGVKPHFRVVGRTHYEAAPRIECTTQKGRERRDPSKDYVRQIQRIQERIIDAAQTEDDKVQWSGRPDAAAMWLSSTQAQMMLADKDLEEDPDHRTWASLKGLAELDNQTFRSLSHMALFAGVVVVLAIGVWLAHSRRGSSLGWSYVSTAHSSGREAGSSRGPTAGEAAVEDIVELVEAEEDGREVGEHARAGAAASQLEGAARNAGEREEVQSLLSATGEAEEELENGDASVGRAAAGPSAERQGGVDASSSRRGRGPAEVSRALGSNRQAKAGQYSQARSAAASASTNQSLSLD